MITGAGDMCLENWCIRNCSCLLQCCCMRVIVVLHSLLPCEQSAMQLTIRPANPVHLQLSFGRRGHACIQPEHILWHDACCHPRNNESVTQSWRPAGCGPVHLHSWLLCMLMTLAVQGCAAMVAATAASPPDCSKQGAA
jgi:hypothetical protein